MSAPELTQQERAIVERFDAAPAAEESWDATVNRVAAAILDGWDGAPGEWDMTEGITWIELARISARAAIAAMRSAS
jgi:hypothetical protein